MVYHSHLDVTSLTVRRLEKVGRDPTLSREYLILPQLISILPCLDPILAGVGPVFEVRDGLDEPPVISVAVEDSDRLVLHQGELVRMLTQYLCHCHVWH